jgi:hypothetical protein
MRDINTTTHKRRPRLPSEVSELSRVVKHEVQTQLAGAPIEWLKNKDNHPAATKVAEDVARTLVRSYEISLKRQHFYLVKGLSQMVLGLMLPDEDEDDPELIRLLADNDDEGIRDDQ